MMLLHTSIRIEKHFLHDSSKITFWKIKKIKETTLSLSLTTTQEGCETAGLR